MTLLGTELELAAGGLITVGLLAGAAWYAAARGQYSHARELVRLATATQRRATEMQALASATLRQAREREAALSTLARRYGLEVAAGAVWREPRQGVAGGRRGPGRRSQGRQRSRRGPR